MHDGQKTVTAGIVKPVMLVCARVLAAIYALGFAFWYWRADGLKDLSGTPLGADFINVYAAGMLALKGQAVLAYDWAAHAQMERQVAHYDVPYFAWHYPPLFLFVAALVALLPYLWALAVYLGLGFLGYVAVLRRLAPKSVEAFWLIVAFPGVFDNVINGQNGFITAGLFGAGFLWLETNPVLAGVMFGLMAYKPQFFVLIPVMLAVGGYWRALLASGVTVVVACFCAWVVFGTEVWQAFLASEQVTQHLVLEQGTTGWKKIQSVFSLARMWGCDVTQAYMVQGVVGVMAVACAIYVWRRKADLAVRVGALCAAILLVTPYVLDYDLIILAVPMAMLARRGVDSGFRRYEAGVLAALWFLPMLARAIGGHGILLTPFVLAALMAVCMLRCSDDFGRRAIAK